MSKPLVRRIKKYANRRLYDMEASAYITLDELAESIRKGARVEVLDARSGRDLTQPTLAQIILESRGGSKLLPVPVLVRLIRMGDDALAEFMGSYIAWALDVYLASRRTAEKAARYNPFAMMPFSAADTFARWMGATRDRWGRTVQPTGAPWEAPSGPGVWGNEPPWGEPPPADPHAWPDPEAEPEPEASSDTDVADLRREVAELKDLLRAVVDKG